MSKILKKTQCNSYLTLQHPEFVDATALGSSFNLTARVVDGVGNTQQATIIVNIKKEMNTDRKLVFEQVRSLLCLLSVSKYRESSVSSAHSLVSLIG